MLEDFFPMTLGQNKYAPVPNLKSQTHCCGLKDGLALRWKLQHCDTSNGAQLKEGFTVD
jgi:hypothetical protein